MTSARRGAMPCAALMVLAACGLAGPAMGQPTPVTDAGADDIRAAIEDWVERTAHRQAVDGYGVWLDTIDVRPAGDRYEVTITNAGISDGVSGGLIWEVFGGPFQLFVTPRPDGSYDVAWQLPDQLALWMLDRPAGDIRIGEQHGGGWFSPTYETMLASDVRIADIALMVDDDSKSSFTIGEATIAVDSVETTPGIFDMVSKLEISDIRFSSNYLVDEVVNLRVGSASLEQVAAGFDLGTMLTAEEAMIELMIGYAPVLPQDLLEDHGVAIATIIEDMGNDVLGAFDIRFSMRDFSVDTPDGPVEFGVMDYSVFADDLGGDEQATIGFEFGFADANAPLPPDQAELFPHSMRLNMAISRIPNQQLNNLFLGFLRGSGTAGVEVAMVMAATQALGAAMSAGTVLELREASLEFPDSTVIANGSLEPNNRAAYRATGDAFVTVTEPDRLLESISRQPDGWMVASTLRALTATGERGADEDGRPTLQWTIALTEAGEVLFNGIDISDQMDSLLP